MAGKTQFMALVADETMYRLDRLRLVSRASRAQIARDALESGLNVLEVQHAMGLDRLQKLADAANATTQEYVKAYATVYARTTYGVGLEALEQDDKAVRKQITAGRKGGKTKAPAAA